MRWSVVVSLVFFGAVSAAPKDAVVRVPSHGGSATVIATGKGWSYLLSCRHMVQGRDRNKPMAFDIPVPVNGAPQKVGSLVVAVDAQADLSLFKLNYGPLPYVSPVAPPGFVPGPCLSVGYDEMKLPGQCRPANIVRSRGNLTLTRERPWHGRSGGGLIDQKTGYLIGVVSAYEGPSNRAEIQGGYHGVYASHAAILTFLKPHLNIADARPQQPEIELAPIPRSRLEIAMENRVRNGSGSQCVWASLETLARHHKITSLYDLTAKFHGTASQGPVSEVLTARKVKFTHQAQGVKGQGFVKKACDDGWFCMVGIRGVHAVVCCGYDSKSGVKIIDNSDSSRAVQTWSMERWKQSFDGWAVVIYPTTVDQPGPPVPDEVDGPQRPQQRFQNQQQQRPFQSQPPGKC